MHSHPFPSTPLCCIFSHFIWSRDTATHLCERPQSMQCLRLRFTSKFSFLFVLAIVVPETLLSRYQSCFFFLVEVVDNFVQSTIFFRRCGHIHVSNFLSPLFCFLILFLFLSPTNFF